MIELKLKMYPSGEKLRMTAITNNYFQVALLSYSPQTTIFDRFEERSAILYKVLIIDDRLVSRKGIRALMLTQPDIQVIGEATNGEKAIQFVNENKPDVVVIDAFMPVMNGLEATRIIKKRWRNIRVVILTLNDDIREEAIAAGADAFLVKGCSPDDLILEIKNKRRNQNDF